MNDIRSYLGRLVPSVKSEAEMEAMRKRAWKSQGCIVCFPQDIHDEWLRQALINWITGKYGTRDEAKK